MNIKEKIKHCSKYREISSLLGIIGIILGITSAVRGLIILPFSEEIIINISISLIASLLGILALWLSNKDYKIAFAEYLIAGAGLIIGVHLISVIGAISFFIAGILLYIDKNNSINEVKV